eukprot:4753455-Amphidinium_carterae.1
MSTQYIEAREIRTPNLLIWSQTRCRWAIAPCLGAEQHMWQHRARQVAQPGKVSTLARQHTA